MSSLYVLELSFEGKQELLIPALYVCYPWYYSCRHKSRQVQKTVNCLMKKMFARNKVKLLLITLKFCFIWSTDAKTRSTGVPFRLAWVLRDCSREAVLSPNVGFGRGRHIHQLRGLYHGE